MVPGVDRDVGVGVGGRNVGMRVGMTVGITGRVGETVGDDVGNSVRSVWGIGISKGCGH